jgi:orotate phosphoribosyltransferase
MEASPARAPLLALLRELAYERRQVTLASGRESDFYIDCRRVSLHAEGMILCGQAFHSAYLESGISIDAVGGPTLGADPLICAFTHAAHAADLPMHAFIVRKEPKGHGTGRMVEGMSNLQTGSRVLLLEDVITTGGSTVRTIEACRETGLEVVQVMVLVDRQEGGREAIESTGVPCSALFTRADFTD